MSESVRPSLACGIAYKDPKAALQWLGNAFGFEVSMVIEDDRGVIVHSEMRVGDDGLIMVGAEWDDLHKSPATLGGVNTQSIHVHLRDAEDLDAHYARACAAGAETLRAPADQFYGDRNYVVRDLEGHQWSFSRTVKVLTLEEMSAAGGVRVRQQL